MSLVGKRTARINGVTDLQLSNGGNIPGSTITVVNGTTISSKTGDLSPNSIKGRTVVNSWYSRVGNINNNNIEFSCSLNGEDLSPPIITRPLRTLTYGFFMVSRFS